MKTLSFYYLLKIAFSGPVHDHRFTVKCVPLSGERQEIRNLKVKVYPNDSLSDSRDSFGNHCIFGYSSKEHEFFEVEVSGEALVGKKEREYAGCDYQMGRYRYHTSYTRPGERLRMFHGQFQFPEGMTPFDKSLQMMEQLYREFSYEPGVTNFLTTGEEALALGRGVCQDYAHILIALCKMEGIPARYVVGMLEGEGASHAWVEIYQENHWYALDPTNRLVVDDRHIKISSGRDYNDCIINQGMFTGNVNQQQTVKVLVKELT